MMSSTLTFKSLSFSSWLTCCLRTNPLLVYLGSLALAMKLGEDGCFQCHSWDCSHLLYWYSWLFHSWYLLLLQLEGCAAAFCLYPIHSRMFVLSSFIYRGSSLKCLLLPSRVLLAIIWLSPSWMTTKWFSIIFFVPSSSWLSTRCSIRPTLLISSRRLYCVLNSLILLELPSVLSSTIYRQDCSGHHLLSRPVSSCSRDPNLIGIQFAISVIPLEGLLDHLLLRSLPLYSLEEGVLWDMSPPSDHSRWLQEIVWKHL